MDFQSLEDAIEGFLASYESLDEDRKISHAGVYASVVLKFGDFLNSADADPSEKNRINVISSKLHKFLKDIPWNWTDESQDESCSICLMELSDMKLNCGHKFGVECILKWLVKKKNCPLCRQAVNYKDYLDVNYHQQ